MPSQNKTSSRWCWERDSRIVNPLLYANHLYGTCYSNVIIHAYIKFGRLGYEKEKENLVSGFLSQLFLWISFRPTFLN